MSDFQWDPASTQIYNSSFGNTELNGTGSGFAKKSGTGFTMDAPGCKLSLNISDETSVNWPLMDGETDTFLDLYFEQGDFALDAKGRIYLGMKSDGGRYNTSVNIRLDVTQSTTSITSTTGQIIIGGKDKSFLQARYKGELNLQALQINFCAGNINCDGNSKITCSAINIEANHVNGDAQGVCPVFNLITDNTDIPQIEFKNIADNGKIHGILSVGQKNKLAPVTLSLMELPQTIRENSSSEVFRVSINSFFRQRVSWPSMESL